MLNKTSLLTALISGVLTLPLSATQNNETFADLTNEQKLYGLSLYWKEASYNFAFFDQVPHLDFDKAYQEFIPRVLATSTTYEYYRELMRFNALLEDGHTNVYLPKGMSQKHINWPAVTLKEAGQEAIVTSVSYELKDTLPLGSKITAVDGLSTKTYLNDYVMPYIASSTEHILWDNSVRKMLNGEPNTKVNIKFETPSGDHSSVTLTRNARGKDIQTASLKLPSANGALYEFKWLDNSIAYIGLNGFHDKQILQDFYASYPEIKKAKGLIIDLRFNGGGNSDIAAEILSHFSKDDLKGAIWKTRKHIAAYKAWGAYYDEYKTYANNNAWEAGKMEVQKPKEDAHIVPTVVMFGRNTASAAEDFLIYADKLTHFTTIGEKSFGSTGQPIFFDLPGGGKFRICTKRDTYPDGKEFVGYGITPDITINRTAEHLISEKDVVLIKALEALKQKL